MRLPAMAAISGAQEAETASSGSSTMLMRPDSGWPKVLVMNSNSLAGEAGEVGGAGLALFGDVDVDVVDAAA